MTESQRRQDELRARLAGKSLPVQEQLGTPFGLLANELTTNPHASLQSIFAILEATRPLHQSSVYSRDCSFLLYILLFALDVEAYVVRAIQDPTLPTESSAGEPLLPLL